MNKFEKDSTYALLAAAQNGDSVAKAKLTEDNFGLVLSVAKKFYNRGYDKDDINQLGAIGLVRAIDNFNLSCGVMFSTYAVPVIMGEIRKFLRDDGPLKVSRTIKQTAMRIAHFVDNEQKSKGKSPDVQEIARVLSITPEEVVEALDATHAPKSIFATSENSDICLADTLIADSKEGHILTRIDIKSALSSLDSRERSIIIMRYYMDKTQSDVAKKIGVSQVQVSRLEKKILEKLKNTLACEN